MDWGRAKNVLIYAFLLLNLVLGYQLWNDLREQADSIRTLLPWRAARRR